MFFCVSELEISGRSSDPCGTKRACMFLGEDTFYCNSLGFSGRACDRKWMHDRQKENPFLDKNLKKIFETCIIHI